ncbi:daptide-type RiPP biosynthesis aminotransferase [Williamsia sp. MIQD14]|uniref:daptide-type RiPP biosynthesis aminotransferase n=1 Tax=Williamsia sp. MIQD14 TaxID=3425703 RepID=UPI003DA0BEC6
MSRGALWPSLITHDLHGHEDLCMASAHGVRVKTAAGVELLDGSSGLWNVNLGYGNEVIADAIGRAARDASYLSVFRYENTYARAAAEALRRVAGPSAFSRVIFSTAGGAANDLSMKLARQFHALDGRPQRNLIAALDGSFHGLTFGGFALTGEDLGQQIYGVDQRLIRHVAPNDGEALTALMRRQGDRIAAMVVEPMLGSGAVALTEEYIATLLDLREQYGFLLVADEVATGFWRTGTYFASQRWPEPPDLLVTSKGLTNGTSAGSAVLVAGHVDERFDSPGGLLSHGETQAGTPITCAAICATIDEVERLAIADRVPVLAAGLDAAIDALSRDTGWVRASVGPAAFRAVALSDPRSGEPLDQRDVAAVVASIRAEGAIVHPGISGVQLVPALVYTDADLDALFACITRGLERFAVTAAVREAG